MSFNEFYGGRTPSARATGALGAVKIKNRLLALRPGLVVRITNTRINGALKGCAGFVGDGFGHWVYLNTESAPRTGKILYRSADGPRDHRGGTNRFSDPASWPPTWWSCSTSWRARPDQTTRGGFEPKASASPL